MNRAEKRLHLKLRMPTKKSKCVRQLVEISISGQHVKTTRRWRTAAYAARELGQPSPAESVLNSGDPLTRTRTLAGGVRIVTTWQHFAAKDREHFTPRPIVTGAVDVRTSRPTL